PSSKLSPSVESLRSFRPRPTETSSGSATSHSIVNAIWSSASSICSSTSAPSPHVTTSLREISSPGFSWLPLQSSSTEYRPLDQDVGYPIPCAHRSSRVQAYARPEL